MTGPRLAAAVEASALIRRISGEGGFATIIAKGDAERGSLLLIITERGRHAALLERMLNADGDYHWQSSGPSESNAIKLAEWLANRRRSDPDLWLIELDVPSAERFIAETISTG